MSELDSPAVQAAIAVEHRLTAIEGTLRQLLTVTTELKERVGTQNGRVGKNEQAIIRLQEQLEDNDEHILKPLRAMVDSIGSQVKQLWEERVSHRDQAAGRSSMLRLQWRIAEKAGQVLGSSAVIGAVIAILRALEII